MPVVEFSGALDTGIDWPNVPSKKHPGGKAYRVESLDAADGLTFAATQHLAQFAAAGGQIDAAALSRVRLNDDDERDFYARILGCSDTCRKQRKDGAAGKPCGSTHDQMVADGVAWPWFEMIAQHAFVYFFVGPAAAAKFLADRGKAPEPEQMTPVPNRAEKRAAAKAGQKSAPASGATAKPTRPRASTASSSRSRGSAAKKAPGRKAV